MSLIDNISKVAMTSEYPPDKIVDVVTGSFNTATSERIKDSFGSEVYACKRVKHNFTRPVFTKMKWSLDGVTWVDGGLGQLVSDPLIYGIAPSNSTEVMVLTTLLSGTFYYEIICFWIDDYDGTNPSVEPYNDPTKPINFDSEDEYQKIFLDDVTTFTSISQTVKIPHDLGYTPDVWVFFESNPGEVWPAIVGGADNVWLYNFSTQGELDYQIYTDRLELTWDAGVSFSGSARAWYKIYLDS